MRVVGWIRTLRIPSSGAGARAGSVLLVCLLVSGGPRLVAGAPAPPPQAVAAPVSGVLALYRHGPYSAGRCDACHAPHEAVRVPGLIAPERELCFFCHQDLQKSLATGYRHRVVREEPCSTCHNPHASPNRAMLQKPEGELCLDCHPKVKTEAGRQVVHRPVAEGRCTLCHDPHNSPNRYLLKANLDSRFYAPYAAARFALCFRCHPPETVEQQTGTTTGFRNGRKSDHYFHVGDPGKSRSCWVCHEAHGSDQPHLIKRSVAFGQWALPIRFEETPLGGACLCGCHRRLEYRRN